VHLHVGEQLTAAYGDAVRPAAAAYLLCSDGLSDLVEVTEIERILADRAGDDWTAVKALWAAAMNAGGRDNITVVLVRTRQLGHAAVAAGASLATASPEED
jgi:serine/threonine protein phosphatase PrpC